MLRSSFYKRRMTTTMFLQEPFWHQPPWVRFNCVSAMTPSGVPKYGSSVDTCRPSAHVSHGLLLPTPLFSFQSVFVFNQFFGFCLGSRANWAVSHQPATSDPFYKTYFTLFLYLVPPDYFRRRRKWLEMHDSPSSFCLHCLKMHSVLWVIRILELLLPSLHLSTFSLICKL